MSNGYRRVIYAMHTDQSARLEAEGLKVSLVSA